MRLNQHLGCCAVCLLSRPYLKVFSPFIYSSCGFRRVCHVLGELRYSDVFWQVVFPGVWVPLLSASPLVIGNSGPSFPGPLAWRPLAFSATCPRVRQLELPTPQAFSSRRVTSQEGCQGYSPHPNNGADRGASGVASLCVSQQGNKKRVCACKLCSRATMQFLLQHPRSLNYKLSPCGAAAGEEGGVRSNNSSPG